MEPIYATDAAGLRWVNLLIGGLVALCIVVCISLIASSVGLGPVIIVLTSDLGAALLVWLIVPRRFEVWADRLRLAFPALRWDIRFETVADVVEPRWWQPYAMNGVRFATSPSQSVVIKRLRPMLLGRPNLIISPANRDEFLAQLTAALESFRSGPGGSA